jgi:hypothetical protein
MIIVIRVPTNHICITFFESDRAKSKPEEESSNWEKVLGRNEEHVH